MKYYEVQVANRAYFSKKPLTYQHETSIPAGTVVTIPVRNKKMLAFVAKEVKKPSFETKEIIRISPAPPLPAILQQLYTWLEGYYPSRSGSALQLFLPNSLARPQEEAPDVTAPVSEDAAPLPSLTKDQARAVQTIIGSSSKSFLLHGETGSGKTRVYAELAKHALDRGGSAIILTPEIGLTTQLSEQIASFLGAEVFVLHSLLTNKERRDIWHRLATTKDPVVVVGTRSALFVPLSSVGLIVIDEAHDDAYKQEQAPTYQTSRVAGTLAALHKAQLVLGSATPSITDMAIFEHKQLPIIDMQTPARPSKPAETTIIDIKERGHFSRSPHISTELLKHIEGALTRSEQSLIYLNRRGTARLVLCQSCGWESLCPRCDIAYTFHDDTHTLVCHTCGHSETPPTVCPQCQSPDIYYKQIGTKALVSHIQKLFPEARVERFDTDQTKHQRLEARYAAIKQGEVDILVGTQLLGKGLDLPLLSVVGVVQADSSLLIPDFTAREKTYQQLHQIIGRVGRGHRNGFVVVQTTHPDSPLIKAALQKDYDAFYAQELQERKQYFFPPFVHLLQVQCTRSTTSAAERAMVDVAHAIKDLGLPVTVQGPSPAFKAKTHGKYHWQIIVKSKQRDHLLHIIDALPAQVSYDLDPINLL